MQAVFRNSAMLWENLDNKKFHLWLSMFLRIYDQFKKVLFVFGWL